MVPGWWFRIPWHSGTQFKHRKVHEKARKRQEQQMTSGKGSHSEDAIKEIRRDLKDRFADDRYTRKISKLVVPTFLISFSFLFFLAMHYTSRDWVEYENERRQNRKAYIAGYLAEQDSNAYRVLVHAGNGLLIANLLDEAQGEFVRALRIDNRGVAANVGLSKTLSQQCLYKGEWCRMAAAYIDYSIELSPKDKEELLLLKADLQGGVVHSGF